MFECVFYIVCNIFFPGGHTLRTADYNSASDSFRGQRSVHRGTSRGRDLASDAFDFGTQSDTPSTSLGTGLGDVPLLSADAHAGSPDTPGCGVDVSVDGDLHSGDGERSRLQLLLSVLKLRVL